MSDKLKNIKTLPPCILSKGNYEIDIKDNIMLDLANEGSLGKNTKWQVVFENDNMVFIDLVTLKKVLEKEGHYPKLSKNEVMTITSLSLHRSTNELCICGDIIKVTPQDDGRG